MIVNDSDTCYRVLGQMHSLYKPRPGRVKGLHRHSKSERLSVFAHLDDWPARRAVEVQIRTEDMDQMAEMGVAAHWAYKEHGETSTTAQIRAQRWMQSLLELQQSAGSSFEFIESVKSDLFPDEIYVFTPEGRIVELPAGATPGRLRLCGAYRYRSCLRGRACRPSALPAVAAADQRSNR